MKELTAYVIDGHELRVRPAPIEREWMDASNERFAYRCLPLNIANAHGWEILCTTPFSAIWDGRTTIDAVRITSKSKVAPLAVSHFGGGTLTFHVPCLFQTEPGVDLFVTGPLNRPKDAIAPLSGIVETDWSPYTFTMNWLFTRPLKIVNFEIDEPFCHLFPIVRGSLDGIAPRICALSQNPRLSREFREWSDGRNAFNAALANPASQAAIERWQKNYFRGVCPSGARGSKGHCTRLRLQPFEVD